MPDPLIASAFVRIKPEPKSVSGFGKEVRTAIEKSFLRPVRIKVDPQLLPFKKKIQTELSSAVFTVKVTPVLVPGFKGKVQKLAREAAAGVTIPVKPIVPVGGAAATARKPTAGTVTRTVVSSAASREEAFLKRLKALTDQQTLAQKALTKAEQTGGTAKERKAAINQAVTKTEAAYNAVVKQQVALEGTLTQKQAGRLATSAKRAQASAAAAAALKTDLAASVAKAAEDRKGEAVTKRVTDLESRRLLLRKQLAAADTAGALKTTQLSSARAVLAAKTSALNAAEALNRDAMKTTDLRLQRLTAAIIRRAEADIIAAEAAVKTAIADEKAGTAAAHRTARETQLGKGLLATALAAAGARGATLAAGFEFLAGAAVATGIFKSVQLAAQLETELNVFRVTAGATADEMERVSAAARELGADITLPAVSANDAAAAMTELAKAGLSVQDSIDAARGTLQLGTAAQIDNATAVNLTASALNAFGLAGTQAVHVADLLAGAARESQGTISDMGGALSSVASVARQAGVSVEDTIALLTLLTKNGIQGAESGTALRVALLRLIAPTDKAAKVLDKLGISVLNSIGNVRPQVFADIARETSRMGAAQRNAALQTIFGTRAIRAQAVLGREGVAGLEAMRDATNQMGLAAEDAAARTAGFAGQIEALKNSMSTLGEQIGRALIPVFENLIESATETITIIGDVKTALAELEDSLPGEGGKSEGFFGRLTGNLRSSLGEQVQQFRALLELTGKRGPKALEFGKGPIGTINALNDEISKTIDNADKLAIALDKSGSTGKGGPVGRQVANLEKLKDQIFGTSEEAERLRARIDAVIRLVVALGRAPTAIELKVLFEKGGVDKALVDAQNRLDQTKLNIQLGLDKKSVVFLGNDAKDAGAVAAQAAHDQFALFFGQAAADDPINRFRWDPFFLLAPDAAGDAGKTAAAAFKTSFDTELAVLEATGGSDAAILSVLRERLAKRQDVLRRAQARFAANPTKDNDAFVGRAAALVSETQKDIKAITDKQVTEAKSAADKIATARNKADQAFLDALGLRRGKLENAILRAEGSTAIEDDIKTHTALRNFFKNKIQEASKTIKDAQTKAETIQSLTADLISENQKIKELNRQLVESLGLKFEVRLNIAQITGSVKSIRKIYAEWIDALQKALAEATKGSKLAQELKLKILETQKAAFSAINEGFELDIQIAEAQERPRAEVRARQRFIEQLRRERDQFRKGSLEYKRLTLEIITQQKAIEEAQKALGELNDGFSKLAFEFLTTQQGFGATLLGNLLPSGAIGGTVAAKLAGSSPTGATATATGNFSSTRDSGDAQRARERLGIGKPGSGPGGGGPSAALAEQGRVAEAGRTGGFTAAQAATLIALTKQIVVLLGGMDAKAKHPENKRQHQQDKAAMDGMGN